MNDANRKTIEAYENDIEGYIDGTEQKVSGGHKKWLDKVLKYIPKNGEVLEIGSAFGRDAKYIQKKGFRVTPTEAVQGFVDLLEKEGYKSEKLNVITDEIKGKYDLVFASAVFLHFNPDELGIVLDKVKKVLRPNGILTFSLKEGMGSEWSGHKLKTPRFFQYWKTEPLKKFVNDSGYQILESGSWLGRRDNVWLYIIAK